MPGNMHNALVYLKGYRGAIDPLSSSEKLVTGKLIIHNQKSLSDISEQIFEF